jgi:heme/copper-type cytochrome/quinol oxidase subunit 1
MVFFSILLLVLFQVFYFKTGRIDLRTQMSFVIVLFCGFLITVLFTGLVAFLGFLFRGGWTIYPPLSASDRNDPVPSGPDSPFAIFSILTILCQILVVILTLRSAARLGEYRATLRKGR